MTIDIANEYEYRLRMIETWSKDKSFQEWRLEHFRKNKSEAIRSEMMNIIERGNIVWCRNGLVCDVATPCIELECSYKISKDDQPEGPAKCLQFQITDYSTTWQHARLLFKFASVEPSSLSMGDD